MYLIWILICPNSNHIVYSRISWSIFKVLSTPLSLLIAGFPLQRWYICYASFKEWWIFEVFDPVNLPYVFYRHHIKKFLEQSGKYTIKNRTWAQDLSAKGCAFCALLYFIFWCRGCTYSKFLSKYGEKPRLNHLPVRNTLSYLYDLNIKALRVKCFKNIVEFVY